MIRLPNGTTKTSSKGSRELEIKYSSPLYVSGIESGGSIWTTVEMIAREPREVGEKNKGGITWKSRESGQQPNE